LRVNNVRLSRFLVGLNPMQALRFPLESVTGSAASKHAVSVTAYRSAPLQIIEDIRESGFSLRDSLSLKVLTIEREPVLRSYAGEETPERVYAQLTIRYHFSDRGNDLQTRSSRSDIYFLDSTFLIDAFGNFGPIDRVVITGAMSKKGWEICCLPIMNRATGLFPEPPHPGLFPIV
ncbi:MAG: hypothetical protein LUD68_01880, partial [Rikenellaceae bacterium]|nr:hypothetical protein [Rikenellaceae bacterium]